MVPAPLFLIQTAMLAADLWPLPSALFLTNAWQLTSLLTLYLGPIESALTHALARAFTKLAQRELRIAELIQSGSQELKLGGKVIQI